MYISNVVKLYIFLAIFGLLLGSCAPIDSFFPSIGNYKIDIQINNVSLDESSFVRSNDRIRPFFENSVSDDPDVTGLEIFLRDSMGIILDWRIIFELDPDVFADDDFIEYEEQEIDGETEALTDEVLRETAENSNSRLNYRLLHSSDQRSVFVVRCPDNLPSFTLPDNLPIGRYVIVFHVMGGNDVLQRIENTFFHLGNIDFSFEGINVHLPGVAETTQLIPRGTLLMLEADLTYYSGLDPYIEWFIGRRRISEGKISEGAGQLFWRVPEDTGFFSIRALISPAEDYRNLSGFQREISLLVTSNPMDIHLVSEPSPDLMHWYIFEGNLNDSKMPASAERALSQHGRDSPRWKGSGGTYGIAAGFGNHFYLPRIPVSQDENQNYKMLFRLKPLNDGGILSVSFNNTNNVRMHLYIDGPHLILTLSSPLYTVSQTFPLLMTASDLPVPIHDFAGQWQNVVLENDFSHDDIFQALSDNAEHLELSEFEQTPFEQNLFEHILSEQTIFEQTIIERNWVDMDSFFTISINFSITEGLLSARLNVMGDFINAELAEIPIVLEAEVTDTFQIMLGYSQENSGSVGQLGIIRATGEEFEQLTESGHEFTALWDEFALFNPLPVENDSDENQSDEEPLYLTEISSLQDEENTL